MRPLEALIAVVAALCALSVSALNSYVDRCKDHPRSYTEGPLDMHFFCGRQPHGDDPLIWLGGNRTNFLDIQCLKLAENYTCEDIPEFDFGHNDTINELSFLGCPMTFVSIACLERRLGVREALKLTVENPRGGFQWLREDMERLQGVRWISFNDRVAEEDVTITSEALAPLSALERLDLAFTRPRLAPGALAVLRALTHLQLKDAYLSDSDLPPGALANLPALTDLNLSVNSLVNITYDTFQNLTSLEKLDLSFNEISSLDGAVLAAGCPRLRELKATSNPLVELRPLEHLQHLVKLELSFCNMQPDQLKLFPRALGALPQLAHVHIQTCNARTLPADLLVGSKSLLTLNLGYNQLRTLPESVFSDQHMLQKLDFSFNELEALPKELFLSLAGLQELKLCHNHLRVLPESLFTNKRMLQNLDLSYNELETLPQEFSSLVGLQQLNLKNNRLRALPASVFTNQRMLQDVNFSENKLETLPKDLFSHLVELQCLNLQNNLIKTLPVQFLEGLSVDELNLSENPLRCDCHLYQLALRMRESKGNATLPRITVFADCAEPPSLRYKKLSYVDLHDLTCKIPA